MGTRVYILLDVVEGKAEEAARTLRGNPGVKLADVLEGRPNVVTVLQARSRSQLAELTNRALALVEGVTESLQVLPTLNGCDTNLHTGCYKAKSACGEHYLKSTDIKAG
jgi:hypothetical protein